VKPVTADSLRQPVDPTGGEIAVGELRTLVRRVADTVGKAVATRVNEQTAAGVLVSSDAEKVTSVTAVHRELDEYNRVRVGRGLLPLSDHAREAVVDAVIAHVYGLGELDVLWAHPDVENIDVNGPDRVWVTFVGGEKVRWTPIAGDQEELIDLIRRAARRLGHNEAEFDARHPQLDLQLPDGSRLFAVFGGDAGSGVATQPALCIRRHRHLDVTTTDLVRLGLLPAAAAEFLVAAFRAGENLIVAGDHNAGKTTLLRAVALDAIAPHQRVVTVEAFITELGLHNSPRLPNVVALYSRPPSAEGDGEVTVADLIRRATRRLNPTRVIVGEILGDEVGPVLDVFSGSTRGSGCTIHARSARGAVRRFEQYGLASQPPVPIEAINHGLAEASPIIVHLAGDESTAGRLRRTCTSISEVTGLEAGRVTTTELWGVGSGGELEPRHAISVGRRERLARSGWDWHTQGWVPEPLRAVAPVNGSVR
jgi:Flp pilus assembly CpaF family ATPase